MREHLSIWQQELANGFTSANELLAFLSIAPEEYAAGIEQKFKTRVPKNFARRMQPGNRYDPLLLQVLATQDEMLESVDFVLDPLDERSTNKLPGLIHKYYGRVLLTVTGVCAVNCRYCFRRNFSYTDNNPGKVGWQKVIDYIGDDQSISEVILSGGDPLLATDTTLAYFLEKLSAIQHVKTVRIHTRIPVVLPSRITDKLCDLLQLSRLRKVIVLHSNHPNELDNSVYNACQQLRNADCHLLNKSVLLKNVNDDAHILAVLSDKLFTYGVLPYYLHILDQVKGAAHFALSYEYVLELFAKLQTLLPGYLVPRLVKEESHMPNKTIYGKNLLTKDCE